MKRVLFFLFAGVSLAQCQGQHPGDNTDQTAPYDTLALHRDLRDILRMQLPLTAPEKHRGDPVAYSYSLKLSHGAEPVWELVRKFYDPETQEITGGGRYLLPQSALKGAGVRLVKEQGTGLMALELRAGKSQQFVWHSYSQEPDSPVTTIRIGWYDTVQKRTLERALRLLEQLVGNHAAQQ